MKLVRILFPSLICLSPLHGEEKLAAEKKDDRLIITHGGKPLADFVFKDPQILRPYFANVKTLEGVQVTRPHPPAEGAEGSDHAGMHPGIWLAFGDVSGHDFWRNKAAIRHERFTREPAEKDGALTFATLSKMMPAEGAALAEMQTEITVTDQCDGWMILWDATFTPLVDGFYFGDQEEMGLGVRMVPSLTEKQGGKIVSSTGKKSAKETWGQIADWCDYSGKENGILLMSAEENFRPCWFHNRDYGLMVANAFGKQAFTKSEKPDRVPVEKGKSLRLRYGIAMHGDFVLGVNEGASVLKWQYAALSQREGILTSARQVIGSLRKTGHTACAGALDRWSLAMDTYSDCVPSSTIVSLYAETCRKLKELYGDGVKSWLWEDLEGYPRIETVVELKDSDGKIHSHLIVKAYNNNDNDSFWFSIVKGPFASGARMKLQPSWELPKGHLRADAE